MKIHKYINNPETLLQQGMRIVAENADNKFVYRISMVNLMLGWFSPKELFSYCGYSEKALQT